LVRVVPNMYPALRVEHSHVAHTSGPSDWMEGLGAHEVIIEHPDRCTDLAAVGAGHVFHVLCAWRARLADLRQDARLVCGLVFRHQGMAAGASVQHPHSQLMALPFVPAWLQAELRAAAQYHLAHGRCALCDVVRHEQVAGDRMVVTGARAVAFAPFASRVPYEVVVTPTFHGSGVEEADDDTLRSMAEVLSEALRRLDGALRHSPHRMWLRTAPWRGAHESRPWYHWHIVISPVTQRLGALEESVHVHVNPVRPEDASPWMKTGTRATRSRRLTATGAPCW
jgi:UDPglucose--hexose-1-phosphate uridylyltransferase